MKKVKNLQTGTGNSLYEEEKGTMKKILVSALTLLLLCAVGSPTTAMTLEQAKKQQVEAALKGPHGQQIKTSVSKYSKQYGVDKKLIHAIILTESGYNPKAVSVCGATGLGQLMPSTFKARNVGSNIYDIDQNTHATVKHYAGLLARAKGNPYIALAAYNAGFGYIDKYKGQVPPSIKPYVNKVMYHKKIMDSVTF